MSQRIKRTLIVSAFTLLIALIYALFNANYAVYVREMGDQRIELRAYNIDLGATRIDVTSSTRDGTMYELEIEGLNSEADEKVSGSTFIEAFNLGRSLDSINQE